MEGGGRVVTPTRSGILDELAEAVRIDSMAVSALVDAHGEKLAEHAAQAARPEAEAPLCHDEEPSHLRVAAESQQHFKLQMGDFD